MSKEDNDVWLVVIGTMIVGAGGLTFVWDRIVGWALTHRLLVGAEQSIVRLPAADGVGLDVYRLAVLVLALAVSVVGAVIWFHQRRVREVSS